MIDQEKFAHPRVLPIITAYDTAARAAAAEAYEDFVLPLYGEDDAFVLNLAAWGMIGFYVFLKEDPEHFYGVPFGAAVDRGPVCAAREQFRKATERLESAPMP
jgi:hypothetical protein